MLAELSWLFSISTASQQPDRTRNFKTFKLRIPITSKFEGFFSKKHLLPNVHDLCNVTELFYQ